MKKEKAKSESKKLKKELEDKLTNAFIAIVAEYGKVKKSKAVIEKFTKQLSKKIDFKSKLEVAIVETEVAKPKIVKAKPAKKVAETAE